MSRIVDWILDNMGALILILIVIVCILGIAFIVVEVANGDMTPIVDTSIWHPISNGVYYHELAGDGYRCIVIGGADGVAVSCDWR